MSSSRSLSLLTALLLLGTAACANLTEMEPFREVACFEAAKVSIIDAIAAAQKPGGKAIDAAYRENEEMGCMNNDPGYYDVTVLDNGKLSLVSVDARSGYVAPRVDPGFMPSLGAQYLERGLEGSSEARIPVARKITLPVEQAIASAEKDGGKAMEVRVEESAGKAGYTVKLVEHGKLRVTWVAGA